MGKALEVVPSYRIGSTICCHVRIVPRFDEGWDAEFPSTWQWQIEVWTVPHKNTGAARKIKSDRLIVPISSSCD